MRLDTTRITARAKESFSSFTAGQKAVLAIAAVATIAAGLLFTRMGNTTNMTALYSNLAAADAASVTEELTSRGVDYDLANGGSTIMVPRADVYQLRLDLSAKGLPTAGKSGYALLDKQGITTSQFRQRVDYQRALEGELATTITAIEGVDDATVHLVIPEDDLFRDDATHPSASVLVQTRAAAALSPGQVQAIVHLVASSVEGLEPTEVTVADGKGRVLSAPGEESLSAAAGDARIQQTSGFESRIAASIEELLAPVVGQGRAVVRVNADLDFDERETKTERFSEPGSAPALSETTTNETFRGPGAAVGGVLGPDATPIAGANGNTDYQKQQAQRNFAVSKVTEEVKAAPGAVRRMSVAVLVDDQAKGVDTAAVQRLVRAAAGINEDRGDSVEVSRMRFDTSAEKSAAEALDARRKAERQSATLALVRTIAVFGFIMVVLALAYRSARRGSAIVRQPVALPGTYGAGSAAPLELTAAERALAALPDSTSHLPALGPPEPTIEDEIGELIDRQPEEVAQVLRGWLADRRS